MSASIKINHNISIVVTLFSILTHEIYCNSSQPVLSAPINTSADVIYIFFCSIPGYGNFFVQAHKSYVYAQLEQSALKNVLILLWPMFILKLHARVIMNKLFYQQLATPLCPIECELARDFRIWKKYIHVKCRNKQKITTKIKEEKKAIFLLNNLTTENPGTNVYIGGIQ